MQKQDEQVIIGLETIEVKQPAAAPEQTAGDLQQKLQASGVTATAQKSILQVQIDTKQAALAAKAMDGKKGKRMKQKGIASATVSKNPEVEAARRIARTLAANGPITIDDVTEELIRVGRDTAGHKPGDKARMWKGAIFRTSEWVKVHEEQSRLARSRSRPVTMWALKSWLDKNSLNGQQMMRSKFDLDGLRRDFNRAHPNIQPDQCQWFIGTGKLADSIATDIKAAGNEYLGVPVTFVPFAVGAILQYAPPQIGRAGGQPQTGVQAPPTTLGTVQP